MIKINQPINLSELPAPKEKDLCLEFVGLLRDFYGVTMFDDDPDSYKLLTQCTIQYVNGRYKLSMGLDSHIIDRASDPALKYAGWEHPHIYLTTSKLIAPTGKLLSVVEHMLDLAPGIRSLWEYITSDDCTMDNLNHYDFELHYNVNEGVHLEVVFSSYRSEQDLSNPKEWILDNGKFTLPIQQVGSVFHYHVNENEAEYLNPNLTFIMYFNIRKKTSIIKKLHDKIKVLLNAK